MAPAFAKDEKVLCFHHELLYEAKVLESRPVDPNDKKTAYQYRVHYKGWKNTWDDWVPQDRLRKNTEENRELANNLKKDMEATRRSTAKPSSTSHKKRPFGSDLAGSSARGSEERSSVAPPRGTKRGREYEGVEKEDDYLRRPAIKIHIPDTIKSYLVDDWEKVTKEQRFVSLPSKTPVNMFLDDYAAYEGAKRRSGSAEADILEEVIAGVKEYFNKSLSRILLYKSERPQFQDIHTQLEKGHGELAGKQVSDVYGVEHLCRLFVSMPDLIAHTNMDVQSVNRLREELMRMIQWLSKHTDKYLSHPYEGPSSDYSDQTKAAA
ncbi:Esa1p-associated factor [Taxawa tesnikishii (nom. ined.)]|nr:Esa1p-associated factor [Dothideales sp. JES 119]